MAIGVRCIPLFCSLSSNNSMGYCLLLTIAFLAQNLIKYPIIYCYPSMPTIKIIIAIDVKRILLN